MCATRTHGRRAGRMRGRRAGRMCNRRAGQVRLARARSSRQAELFVYSTAKVPLSLKTASCLSKFTQTWREKPANSSDLVSFSGKSFRHGEKIRLHENAHETTSGYKATPLKVCLKSTKNLCLGHRFFVEIRQNPPILLCFQAKPTDSLQKSGAATRSRISCDFMRDETPGTSQKQPCISAPLS